MIGRSFCIAGKKYLDSETKESKVVPFLETNEIAICSSHTSLLSFKPWLDSSRFLRRFLSKENSEFSFKRHKKDAPCENRTGAIGGI